MDKDIDAKSEYGNTNSNDETGRHTFRKPHCDRKQDSWVEFKGRLFKMASTVVLPRNRRICKRPSEWESVKLGTPSLSVKSLPQIRRDDAPPKPTIFLRSISAQHEPRHHISSSPMPPSRKVPFVPQTHSIDEVEEVDSSSNSASEDECFDEEKNIRFLKKKGGTLFTTNFAAQHHISKSRRSMAKTNFSLPAEALLKRDLPTSGSISSELMKSEGRSMHSKLSGKLSQEDSGFREDEEYSEYFEEDEDSLAYHDFYSCMPPPIFMLCITIAEIGFFIYHAKLLMNDPNYGYISKFSPAPMESILIYNPTRRFEVWRYLTYSLVHSGYMHLINNIVVQLVLGILLEMVHKWWRVLAIYFAGILAGSLATSISEPYNFLAGASAGVYALIAAHVSTVILNWSEMEHPWVRVLVFSAFVLHDGGTAIYFGYFVGEKTNVGYAAHLGGAVAGLLVGIHVLKNLQWRKWETILWWLCIVVCIILLLFAIAWNIFRPDLFP